MKKFLLRIFLVTSFGAMATAAPLNPPLNWNPWRGYRNTVVHLALGIKSGDIAWARANIAAHDWAKKYRDDLVTSVDTDVARLTPEFIEQMIVETTPLDPLSTASLPNKKPVWSFSSNGSAASWAASWNGVVIGSKP